MSQDGGMFSRMNFRRSGRRGTEHQEHSPLEGEAGGFSVTTASVTDVTVLVVPSAKTFHLKTLIVQNTLAQAASLNLFASDGGGKQRLAVTLAQQDTLVLGPGDLQGILFGFSASTATSFSTGGLYARVVSASTGINIFAGGQIRDADVV